MKVLVIGSGGREHAICWKLHQSPMLEALYCAPGNPGITEIAMTEAIPVEDIEGLAAFAQAIKADLTVVGPELPLSLGIVDVFKSKGLRVFGPSKIAAQLESSKAFAKEIMLAAGVPTAGAALFTDMELLRKHVERAALPLVLKADGLASGKGVFVCHSREDLGNALKSLTAMKGASQCVLVEDFLEGVEVSYIVATDSERIVPMASSHDYKRLYDKDAGPNTGGMGSVCPTPRTDAASEKKIIELVIEPVLKEMQKRGNPFCGFLYAGLMLGPKGEIRVLEFNARLGDPETQSIMRRLEGDFASLLFALAEGTELPSISWKKEQSVCIVLAAAGYPDNPVKGTVIQGLEKAQDLQDVVIFHAGTSRGASAELCTNGGRVLNVTATGKDVVEAREKVYQACGEIAFNGMQYRKDIALS